jgi:dihydroorotase
LSAEFDLVVRGGAIVDGERLTPRIIAVRGGRIAGLFDPSADVKGRSIDVDGCMVLPGLVDAHVHFREPGLTHKEDFESGSRAAALGGVTTVMVMPTDNPMTETPEQFARKRDLAAGRSHVDFALQALLGPDLAHVKPLAALGAVSFEIFMGLIARKIERQEELVAALAAVREAGGVAGVTPYDDALAAAAPSLPPEIEASGVSRAVAAHRMVGGRMHLRQISSALAVAEMRDAAPGVTSEVTPHNLWLTDEALGRLGALAKVIPPLRPQSDVDAVRAALKEGRVSIVATDHAPHTPQDKALGLDRAPGGFPGVQTLLPLLLRLVEEKILGYPDLVRAACEMPARVFGLYPRKGALVDGADADLAVVDLSRPMRIRDEDQASKARHTPFNAWTAPGSLVMTLLRGRAICREGRLATGPPDGRFVAPLIYTSSTKEEDS